MQGGYNTTSIIPQSSVIIDMFITNKQSKTTGKLFLDIKYCLYTISSETIRTINYTDLDIFKIWLRYNVYMTKLVTFNYRLRCWQIKYINKGVQLYIYGLLSAHLHPTVALRYSCQNRLAVPFTLSRTTILASRAFQNDAPKIWNVLPQLLRDMVQTPCAQRTVDATILQYDNIN